MIEGELLAPHVQALRILFLTLEFRAGTFSGNGVYATAQVRALTAAGHKLFVVSAQPVHAAKPTEDYGVLKIVEVPVSSWHRLDAGAPWREFAAGVLDGAVSEAVRAFAPQVVLAVDWSALQAVRNLLPYCGGAPYVYLNYRVFTRTAVGEDLELIRSMEAAAMSESILTVALSRSDAHYLATQVAGRGRGNYRAEGAGRASSIAAQNGAQGNEEERQQQCADGEGASGVGLAGDAGLLMPLPKVLLPALREDVRQLQPPADLARLATILLDNKSVNQEEAQQQNQQQVSQEGSCDAAEAEVEAQAAAFVASRPYLSCVVRLSPEKEPERFVAAVEALAGQGLLERFGLTPLLLGVANDEYAQALKARLRAAAPTSVILERFVGPAELAQLYRQTRLNFHPSTYDAYGMTIVEAASQGAPSVVHDGDGAVGATDLLRGGDGEVFLVDLEAPAEQVAAAVGSILAAPVRLAGTAVRALRKARSWDEAANAAELVRMVQEAMGGGAVTEVLVRVWREGNA
ncbi:hypothetical protein Agub_g2201, partial [Astrephomene gubernaculifera]